MGLERYPDADIGMKKFVDILDTDTTLEPYQQVVRVSGNGSVVAITLPSVVDAMGKFYSIIVTDATYAVTIQDQDDSEYWEDLAITVAVAHVLLFSDGRAWYQAPVVNDGSPLVITDAGAIEGTNTGDVL